MVHEPYLAFGEGSWRQQVAAAVHRLMVALLLSDARRVWITIPAWADRLKPWAFGRRDLQFCWLPVPSTLPVAEPDGAVPRLRAEILTCADGVIVGHFSTYPPDVRQALRAILPALLTGAPEVQVQLLGRGGERVAEELRSSLGPDIARVQATGELSAASLSRHLQTCDVLLQPYVDGASTRRTTLMAALAHGLPIVTTVGRLSDAFWRDSDAIAAAPAGDLPAVVRTALDLVRQPERRRRLSSAAQAAYESRFSLARLIARLRTDSCVVN
jgi:glycosyltransferase involved in cell wall biosynthesis